MAQEEHHAQRRVIKSRRNREPGRLVRLPLGSDRYGYGRQLGTATVEFHAVSVEDEEQIDLTKLVDTPGAFRVAVMDRAFSRKGRWKLLDVVPLSPLEADETYRWVKQDLISGRLSIYWEHATNGQWGEYSASETECQALERAAAWEPEHVEDRLRDHLEGKPNHWLESLRLRST